MTAKTLLVDNFIDTPACDGRTYGNVYSLNGANMYEVVASAKVSEGRFLLLAKQEWNTIHPFVTWMSDAPDGKGPAGRYWGHYCETEEEGRYSFTERLKMYIG